MGLGKCMGLAKSCCGSWIGLSLHSLAIRPLASCILRSLAVAWMEEEKKEMEEEEKEEEGRVAHDECAKSRRHHGKL